MSIELLGDPGDVAIEFVNISKDPKGKLPLGRLFTVRRMTQSGVWKDIGHWGEYFGPDPEDSNSFAYMFESPSGMCYQEIYTTQKGFEKIFMNYGEQVNMVDFLLQHYSNVPIPV